LTEKIIDFRCFDAREPNHTNYAVIQEAGYARYAYSNIGQWLNSSAGAGQWYSAKHTYDQSPTTEYVDNNTPYAQRPGFLNLFMGSEQSSILNTNVVTSLTMYDGGKTDTVSQKVFIPSVSEVANWFSTGASRICYPTTQAIVNSTVTPTQDAAAKMWRLRDHYGTSIYQTAYVDTIGDIRTNTGIGASYGYVGIRPAMNLPATSSVSDTTDSDGCYTAIWNSAPPVPTTLNVPTIYGGKAFTISWGKVTDPDGQAVTYQLEQSVNGGAFTSIYTGTNLAHTTMIAKGSTSVQFRLKAMDSQGASSGYLTSASKTVINNNAPVISGSDGSLGTKGDGFTQTYTISDSENNTVTVRESIDGVQVRSYVATLGATNTLSVTGNTWLALANGNHTLTITATDGVDTSIRTYTFVKSVNSFTIQNSTPMAASTRPTRIKVIVNKTIPAEATFKVEVCNNGYDSSPAWEDATASMNSGLVHLFSNTTKTATNWGVRIRVTVNRNGGSGACYVSSIGGNWE
jgi:hypothetical protein